MANNWTEEQKQVIDDRGNDLLVSAAAGSGKTAVLVERILQMVTDPSDPVDIDALLVVTFTNAAAGEMRERIRSVIEAKLEETPENTHLQRQSALIHHARIMTIHSFCLDVIRNHFSRIDLDPSFRIADEGEMKLLSQDVMDTLLEESYAQGDAGFLALTESFAPGRSDEGIGDQVERFYEFSRAYPNPRAWRRGCAQAYKCESTEELEQTEWMKNFLARTALRAEGMLHALRQALEMAEASDGPQAYVPALAEDVQRFEALVTCDTLDKLSAGLTAAVAFPRLSTKKDPDADPSVKELVKAIREGVKKDAKKLQEDCAGRSEEQELELMRLTGEYARAFADLTDAYEERLDKAKRERGVLDFGDLEHMALSILVEEVDGDYKPTETAREYALHFKEVMTDEYQDSNLVQEILLTSVSGGGMGLHNRFMVGDVKQSIYRFRLARPDLFMEKYRTYPREAQGGLHRIDLHKNFRSRMEVLEGTNQIFRRIMTEQMGGVCYDADAALYPAASFPESEAEAFYKPEIMLVLPPDAGSEDEDEDLTMIQREADCVARRIHSIVGKEPVFDKETKNYRPAQYRDIVILLRTLTGVGDEFARVLGAEGIPAFTGSGTGYFSAPEVRTVLNMLTVLDNPRQDIPLAAVLRSQIVGMSDEQLARIRAVAPEDLFWDACRRWLEEGMGGEAAVRLTLFLELYRKYRERSVYTPIHELIRDLLEETGYLNYVTAMPAGSRRRANLEMLVQKASAFEQGSYRGLFNFIRYIENLRKYEVDFGEAPAAGESENAVRIMSIHKSKGLEFPVVFVSGLGRKFNRMDTRGAVLLHPDLGIGCECVDLETRTKIPTLLKQTIARATLEEMNGEELRVLYVAMTRAKEKLILTGCIDTSDPYKTMDRWHLTADSCQPEMPYADLMGAGCFLDWIMPAVYREGRDSLFRVLTVGGMTEDPQELAPSALSVMQEGRTDFRFPDPNTLHDPETEQILRERDAHHYPYGFLKNIPGKLTVSALKRMQLGEEEAESQNLFPETEPAEMEEEKTLPAFRKEKTETGAARGTIYHRVMECLDLTAPRDGDFVQTQLETMVKCGKIQNGDLQAVSADRFRVFLESDLGQRMTAAAQAGKLHREAPFVLGIPADQIREEWNCEETVLVQGIIDAWFEENDRIILVDYKSDRLRDPQQFKDRYHAQLDYYSRALTQLTGKPVAEQLIWSFQLGTSIRTD